MQKPIIRIISLSITAIITSGLSHAGSFSLYTEGTAAAIGNYAAGIAAEAANASTGWYNPAGLALIRQQQLVVGAVGVFPNSELTGTSTYLTPPLRPYVQTFDDINGGKNAAVPSLHYARPVGEHTTVGFSVISPFGLSTDWGVGGPVRYSATKSKLSTINVSPEMGSQLSEHFSLGAGLDLQYATVTFNRVLGSPAYVSALSPLLRFAPATYFDSTSTNKAESFAVGFHAGVMVMLNENHTRLGLNYQSKMNHRFHGKSELHGLLASPGLNILLPGSILAANPNATYTLNSLSSETIELPDIVTLSGYHDVNDRFAVLGSVIYTGWNSFKAIQLNNVAAYVFPVGQTPVNSSSEQNYRNTWRISAGANYKVNPKWMMRVGAGFDQTPTNDTDRDVRIADSNRVAVAIGTHYQMRPNVTVDVGYSHLFSAFNGQHRDVVINKTDPIGTSAYNVNARAQGSADLIGLQFNWLIDGAGAPTKA